MGCPKICLDDSWLFYRKYRDDGVFIQPDIEPVNDREYELRSPWVYCWFANGKWHKIQIPLSQRHDGASVPRMLFTLSGLTPDGLIRAGALVHDHLYRHRGNLPAGWYQVSNSQGEWINSPRVFTRAEADALFHQINTETGMSYRRYYAYGAVRVGGCWSW